MNYINGSELANKRFIKLENGDLREVQGKYVPEHGETYYCLNDNVIVEEINRDSRIDRWRLKHTFVFRTKKEYHEYKRFLETLDEYSFKPNWDDPNQERWMICFNHVEHRIEWLRLYAVQYRGFCFESKEKGEAFVDAVGEEAVERYVFNYWR